MGGLVPHSNYVRRTILCKIHFCTALLPARARLDIITRTLICARYLQQKSHLPYKYVYNKGSRFGWCEYLTLLVVSKCGKLGSCRFCSSRPLWLHLLHYLATKNMCERTFTGRVPLLNNHACSMWARACWAHSIYHRWACKILSYWSLQQVKIAESACSFIL